MVRSVMAVLLVAAMFSPAGLAREVSGAEIPESLSRDGVDLKLVGAGVRDKFFIDVYVGAFYNTTGKAEPAMAVKAEEPQAITLHILSDMVTAGRMEDATIEGFEKSTDGNIEPYRDDIDKILEVFAEDIAAGDVFEMVYVPDKGLHVYKNDEFRGVWGNHGFKQVSFGIWLGDKPVQRGLKEAMLGQ